MDLLHEDVGGDHVEVDVLEEAAENLAEFRAGRVAVFLAPHQRGLGRLQWKLTTNVFLVYRGRCSYLELGKLVSFQLLSSQDESHDVLGKQGEGTKIENVITVLINEFQNLGRKCDSFFN